MDDTGQDRYSAVIKIEHTRTTKARNSTERDKVDREATNVSVASTSLEKLKRKISTIIDMMDDDDLSDGQVTR